MPHAVVAIDQGRCFCFLRHMDVGPHIYTTGADAANVLRQTENTVAVRAAQIGQDHQSRDLFGICGG